MHRELVSWLELLQKSIWCEIGHRNQWFNGPFAIFVLLLWMLFTHGQHSYLSVIDNSNKSKHPSQACRFKGCPDIAENRRLSNRLKLPESDQKYLRDQEGEIVELHKKIGQLQQELLDMDEDNINLRKEITGKYISIIDT